MVVSGGLLCPRTMKSGRLVWDGPRNWHLLLFFLNSSPGAFPCRTWALSSCSAPGRKARAQAPARLCVMVPVQPPSELGEEAPVPTSCLAPSAPTSASVRSQLFWLILPSKCCQIPFPAFIPKSQHWVDIIAKVWDLFWEAFGSAVSISGYLGS